MKKQYLKTFQPFRKTAQQFIIFFLVILVGSQEAFSQVGKSTGLEFGFCSGGVSGYSGQNGLFTGAIFKEFMKYNRKK